MDLTLYRTPDDLPRELRYRCIPAGNTGWQVFHHPVYVAPFPLALPRPIEEFLALRQHRADEALCEARYKDFVFVLERPYRLEALVDLARDGAFDDDPGAYWELARTCWMDSDIPERDGIWAAVLAVDLPLKESFMTAAERAELEAMPDPVTVWRGVQGTNEDEARDACLSGHSWTFDPAIAYRFANRFLRAPVRGWIARAEVPKEIIAGYLTERGEAEMVIRPGDLSGLEIALETVTALDDDPDPVWPG
ncbi:hypothetical protein LAZ40_05430 [Cereibacter sphaeroides]|uniref:hypothetical protein n=1 Tax=Cereibacter sphaeroides TaxID=1063 RepID=UPI001F2C5344|nr:hypothetical protein [Cereibacter sphaeroides]MCE6958490.1 hypothetical protein [Cereibacter sphaeroides]MCE6972848.1 hypothetical protein [Cereibacter sphaeroides]